MSVNIIMIETASKCNAHCKYCPQGAGLIPHSNKHEFISDKILNKALSIAQNGKQKIIYLHHRGEPLLHPNIDSIIIKVRNAGFLACFSTNLIAGNELILENILKAGINQIEIHYSGGLTVVSHDYLLQKIQYLFKLNKSIRNNGCRIDINFALQENETEHSIMKGIEKSKYYHSKIKIRFYKPHNWTSLAYKRDLGINPFACQWYLTKSCCVLSNGDIVICCLDHFSYSNIVNVMDLDEIKMDHLVNREICKGCTQFDWFDEWIPDEILKVPNYIQRHLEMDSHRRRIY